MGFEVPLDSGFDPTDSVYVSSPGRYHVAVVDVDEDGLRIGGKNNKGEMVVEFEVLAGSAPGMEGLRHRTYCTKSAAAAWKLHRLALAAGMITEDEIEAHKKASTFPRYEFERDLKGKQLFVEIVNSEYNGKVTPKIEFGIYHLASKQCIDKNRWPRNEIMIGKSGVKMLETKPANKPQDKPAPKPGNDDDLLGGVV